MEIIFTIIIGIILLLVYGKWYQTKIIKNSFDLLAKDKKPVRIPFGIILVTKYLNAQGAGINLMSSTVMFYWNDKLVLLTQEGDYRSGNTIVSFA